LQVQRRFAHGLTFQVSYTFSKSHDDKSYDPTFTRISSGTGQSAQSTPLDFNNRRLTYALSDFDRTHVILGNVTYELPFGAGKHFGGGAGRVMDRLIGGWEVNAIVTRQSGRPFTVVSGATTFTSATSSRANYSGNKFHVQFKDDPVSGVPFIFSPEERAKFSLPLAGEYGNIGRNSFRFPWSFNLDASLIKQVRIRERVNFEFRAEAFNLTNTPYFSFPSVTVTSPATVGRSLGTATFARIVQLGAKVNF